MLLPLPCKTKSLCKTKLPRPEYRYPPAGVCYAAGIITGTMVGIYAPARMMASSTREGLLPPVLAWVGPRQTPWVATW